MVIGQGFIQKERTCYHSFIHEVEMELVKRLRDIQLIRIWCELRFEYLFLLVIAARCPKSCCGVRVCPKAVSGQICQKNRKKGFCCEADFFVVF